MVQVRPLLESFRVGFSMESSDRLRCSSQFSLLDDIICFLVLEADLIRHSSLNQKSTSYYFFFFIYILVLDIAINTLKPYPGFDIRYTEV